MSSLRQTEKENIALERKQRDILKKLETDDLFWDSLYLFIKLLLSLSDSLFTRGESSFPLLGGAKPLDKT